MKIGRRSCSRTRLTSKLNQMVDIRKCGENLTKTYDFSLNTSRKFPTSIMIWDCLSAHGLRDFHILEGRLNASGYIGVLEDKLRPFTSLVFPNGNFSFQQDNAPCHTAHYSELLTTSRRGWSEKALNSSIGHPILLI